MQAVVLAGGKGVRLGEGPPKPLRPLGGIPVLEHVLAWLGREGVRDVVLLVAHRAEEFATAIGDGARLGLRVKQLAESTPLGTAGAVRAARDLLEDRFFVVYADVVADVDLGAMLVAHQKSGAMATLAVHPNDHPLDSDRVVTDHSARILRMVRKEHRAGAEAGALCSAALYVVERALIDEIPDDGVPRDFARDVFPELVNKGRTLVAYRTAEYLKDMGTPSRLAAVEADLKNGVPQRMRRSGARPAVFVDRDGVLIEDRPFITKHEDVVLLPGTAEALSRLNRSRVPAVCVTNQPVIARGEISEDGLQQLHHYLEGSLGEQHAWLDDIFVCPHHPHKGYAGERPELKVACECRKPQPGLFFRAAEAIGIDRAASICVGDRTTDLRAAIAAGVMPVGVLTGMGCRDGLHPIPPETPIVPSLREAVSLMLDVAPSWAPFVDRVRAARVVLVGGKSRAGKTTAAAALALHLRTLGEEVLHVSLDRFILPKSARTATMSFAERTNFREAEAAVKSLVAGEFARLPGYEPRTRERAPTDLAVWSRRGILIVDGLLAHTVDVESALRVAIDAPTGDLAARRRAFYGWKGLAEADISAVLEERIAEDHEITSSLERADLRLTLEIGLRSAS